LILGPWIRRMTGKKISVLIVQTDPKDLVYMTELIESGKVVTVIDKRYSFSEAAEALRYLGEGHAKGKVVITLEHDNKT
jgi:NADPH:quinone reductase-like Zn-dependent oxidoreductase